MNSAEFLALVEKYPLITRAGADTEALEAALRDEHTGVVDWELGNAVVELMDAAPAMAAEILRYVQRHDAIRANLAKHGSPVGREPEVEALRAALPESLRH